MREAHRADLETVLRIQRRAFGRVAAHYNADPSQLEPVRESLEVLTRLRERGALFLVAVTAEGIIGGVRATSLAEGSVEVSRLAVEEGYERQGVATALMRAAEASFPAPRRFELHTGEEMADARALYEGLGYSVFKSETVPPGVGLVWYEKVVSGP